MDINNPLLEKYQAILNKDPSSLVFAPLAEIYRKHDMLEEAMSTLQQGIRRHPDYLLGHLGLTFCYFDLGEYHLAYKTIKPFVAQSRENIRLQRIFAKACYELGNYDECLETYKFILFLNPKDKEAAKFVEELESLSEKKVSEDIHPDKEVQKPISFSVSELSAGPEEGEAFDDWVEVNLPKSEEPAQLSNESPETKTETTFDHQNDEQPIITHTLVDLYCAQGHLEKALEILDNILSLNPDDEKTIQKKKEVQLLLESSSGEESQKEDGRDKLMQLFDSQLKTQNDAAEKDEKRDLEQKLWLFHKKLQKRAQEFHSRSSV